MRTVLDGFLWAFGIMLGLGVIGLLYSGLSGVLLSPNMFSRSAEFELLPSEEYSELLSTVREIQREAGDMVDLKISGQFTLKDPSEYKAVEVFVSLYNKEGIFMGEYTGGKQFVEKSRGPVQFKIDVWDPFLKDEVANRKFRISAE